MNDMVKIKDLRKSFDFSRIKALDGINLNIAKGEYISVMGPSGSGKSTLLNMIGGLDKPDSGSIFVGEQDITTKRELTAYRAKTIGFVFQLHNLLPTQTTLENVVAPMYETKLRSKERRKRALGPLGLVGLSKRTRSYPAQLSGGERQRVAIARALANSPEIILADEPAGNLDSKSSEKIMELLTDIWREEGKTLVVITHEEDTGRRAQRIIGMLDGHIEKESKMRAKKASRESMSNS